jgi:D-xylose transport system substrate-binding protein
MKFNRWLGAGLGFALSGAMLLTACGSSSSTATVANGKGCTKVGVLLPESASSARWEGKDRPALQSAITAALPGATVKIDNANGSDDTQLQQAEADLTAGYCILVVAPHDSAKASAIVQKAKADKVPVIAYDRLIKDPDLNYYVSFDNFAVGVAQGQYIADHYKDYVSAGHNNIAFIKGSQDDNNAILFANGAHSVIDKLPLTNVYETFTPNWDNPTAQTEMEAALTKANNDIQVAYVANDGMATTVIAALTAQKLNGKVLVTGQVATAAGVQQILLGNQNMTIYKPIANEAKGTAQLVAALSQGTGTSSIANQTTDNSGVKTPSVLLPVTSVDKTNVATTVIADGYVTKADLCNGLPAGTTTLCP